MSKFLSLKSTKFISIILIVAHITAFGPVRDVLAVLSESTNYKLDQALFNEGGNNRQAGTRIIKQDSIGEPMTGQSQSAIYTLGGGFVYYIQPNPPQLVSIIPNQTWLENQPLPNAFDLDDYFASFDGSQLSYTMATVSGEGKIAVAIDSVTHLVSFSQPEAWFGTEKIKFTATDSEYASIQSNEITLQVQGVDNPPVLEYIADITVDETALVKITPYATDIDGDAITYSFTPPLDANGEWQTDYDDSGTYTVTVTATDTTHLFDEQTVIINVRNVNRPPVIESILPIIANEGQLVTVTPVVSDPDGDAVDLYYSSPLDTTGKWLTDYDDAGIYTVTVTAFDGIESVTQEVSITINNVNRPPQAALTLSKYTVDPNEKFTIQHNFVNF